MAPVASLGVVGGASETDYTRLTLCDADSFTNGSYYGDRATLCKELPISLVLRRSGSWSERSCRSQKLDPVVTSFSEKYNRLNVVDVSV